MLRDDDGPYRLQLTYGETGRLCALLRIQGAHLGWIPAAAYADEQLMDGVFLNGTDEEITEREREELQGGEAHTIDHWMGGPELAASLAAILYGEELAPDEIGSAKLIQGTKARIELLLISEVGLDLPLNVTRQQLAQIIGEALTQTNKED